MSDFVNATLEAARYLNKSIDACFIGVCTNKASVKLNCNDESIGIRFYCNECADDLIKTKLYWKEK